MGCASRVEVNIKFSFNLNKLCLFKSIAPELLWEVDWHENWITIFRNNKISSQLCTLKPQHYQCYSQMKIQISRNNMQNYRCIIFKDKLLPHSATWNSGSDEAWLCLPFSHWAENLDLCFSEVPVGNYTTVEKTPADVGSPLSSLSSPSTLQRKPVPSVCHTTISIGALQSILFFLYLWHILIIFWGLLISLCFS